MYFYNESFLSTCDIKSSRLILPNQAKKLEYLDLHIPAIFLNTTQLKKYKRFLSLIKIVIFIISQNVDFHMTTGVHLLNHPLKPMQAKRVNSLIEST